MHHHHPLGAFYAWPPSFVIPVVVDEAAAVMKVQKLKSSTSSDHRGIGVEQLLSCNSMKFMEAQNILVFSASLSFLIALHQSD